MCSISNLGSDTSISKRNGCLKYLNHVSNSNFIAYKTHDSINKLRIFRSIIIIRDPKDCIASHMIKENIFSDIHIEKECIKYVRIIKLIKKRDLVINYNHLVSKNHDMIYAIADFFGIKDVNKIDYFLENIDMLYKESSKAPREEMPSYNNCNYYKNNHEGLQDRIYFFLNKDLSRQKLNINDVEKFYRKY